MGKNLWSIWRVTSNRYGMENAVCELEINIFPVRTSASNFFTPSFTEYPWKKVLLQNLTKYILLHFNFNTSELVVTCFYIFFPLMLKISSSFPGVDNQIGGFPVKFQVTSAVITHSSGTKTINRFWNFVWRVGNVIAKFVTNTASFVMIIMLIMWYKIFQTLPIS